MSSNSNDNNDGDDDDDGPQGFQTFLGNWRQTGTYAKQTFVVTATTTST